ncbi:MAG: glycosyltransferase family 4 protein [Planctomycetota bacterium]
MHALVFSSLFPNEEQPGHGVFVRERLFTWRREGYGDLRVVAPVPFWPRGLPGPKRWARYGRVPLEESQSGVTVAHPRYWQIPKVGMNGQGRRLARATAPLVDLWAEEWGVDLIDGHYLYPDGVAAAEHAERLGKPLVLTARGTDVNLLPRFPAVRDQILEAVARADRVITVCAALRDRLVELGAREDKLVVVSNGVDPAKFPRRDRGELRSELGWHRDDRVILSVGLLIDRKGHHHLIDALSILAKTHPKLKLVILGEGEKRRALESQITRLGLETRVSMPGAVPHEDLHRYYGAADVFALASSREGWPNVLLEAMCCGLPVVASKVWGIPEVVPDERYGLLCEERTGEAFARRLAEALERDWDRDAIASYARAQTWESVAANVQEVFSAVLGRETRSAEVVRR